MPDYDRREVHRRRTDTSPDALWRAIHELKADELKVMRALMGIRTLGRRIGDPEQTVLEGFKRMGFREVAEYPDRELVIAGIGQFWKPSGGLYAVTSKEQFLNFREPGYAKAAFNFRIDDGQLSTETRIAATDPKSRRLFAAYWLLIRPGSGLIRREWLRALDRRAQRHPAPS